MKKCRKVLLMLFTLFVLFSSTQVYAKNFRDIKGHWAQKYIDEMSDAGFVTGYEADTFKPDNNISRVEFYAVVNSMANLKKTYTVTFSDVSTSDWFYNDVAKAIKAGYIIPTTGRLNPNAPISRQDVMAILGYMYKMKQEPQAIKKFKDSSKVKEENRGYVGELVKEGIVDGGPDLLLRPNDGISRAEICKILSKLMNEFGLPTERVVMDSKIKFGQRNLYD